MPAIFILRIYHTIHIGATRVAGKVKNAHKGTAPQTSSKKATSHKAHAVVSRYPVSLKLNCNRVTEHKDGAKSCQHLARQHASHMSHQDALHSKPHGRHTIYRDSNSACTTGSHYDKPHSAHFSRSHRFRKSKSITHHPRDQSSSLCCASHPSCSFLPPRYRISAVSAMHLPVPHCSYTPIPLLFQLLKVLK